MANGGEPTASLLGVRGVGSFPRSRPRRLRETAAWRRLVADVRVSPADLVLPLFYREGAGEPIEVTSMPGVVQHTRDSLRTAAAEAVAVGLGGLMLFAIPRDRDDIGSGATDPRGALAQAIESVRTEVGEDTVVMADLCLDEFTAHGHCGVLDAGGRVDNDATLDRYRQMAIALADAGAQAVGTSGMMDGQVGAVRDALEGHGRPDVAILAYAGKAASALYGPFREAVDSTLTGERLTYQQDPAASRDAVRDAALDIAEGADIVMVKPAS
ncbi:MAG: porphobilinogen synthase, partial [Candidatus Nanopelagicales bacterium]|nr:porphobilinogen synthase [Candidatus Nanopelagicales bacterium]